MALANYTELVDGVSKWAKRTDLAALAPMFITLAEARIKTLLTERLQDESLTLTTSAGVPYVALPSDLLHVRALSIPGTVATVEHMTPDQYAAEASAGTSGAPRRYTIIGAQLYLSPTPDAAYSLSAVLSAEFPALTDAAPTNALLTRWPNLYLWGALAEAMKYAQQPDMMAVYENDFQAAINNINLLSWKTPGVLRVQTDVRSV